MRTSLRSALFVVLAASAGRITAVRAHSSAALPGSSLSPCDALQGEDSFCDDAPFGPSHSGVLQAWGKGSQCGSVQSGVAPAAPLHCGASGSGLPALQPSGTGGLCIRSGAARRRVNPRSPCPVHWEAPACVAPPLRLPAVRRLGLGPCVVRGFAGMRDRRVRGPAARSSSLGCPPVRSLALRRCLLRLLAVHGAPRRLRNTGVRGAAVRCSALRSGALCKGSSEKQVTVLYIAAGGKSRSLTARLMRFSIPVEGTCPCLSMRRYGFLHGVRLAALRGLGPRGVPRTQRCMRAAKGDACVVFVRHQRPYTGSVIFFRNCSI